MFVFRGCGDVLPRGAIMQMNFLAFVNQKDAVRYRIERRTSDEDVSLKCVGWLMLAYFAFNNCMICMIFILNTRMILCGGIHTI
jgi:hypothetical protein